MAPGIDKAFTALALLPGGLGASAEHTRFAGPFVRWLRGRGGMGDILLEPTPSGRVCLGNKAGNLRMKAGMNS